MATAYFMQLIISMTDAATDQEHIKTYVSANPTIPDRTGFLLHKPGAEDPRPIIIEEGKRLKESGAKVIAIPCVTAHAFHSDLVEGIGLKVVHAMEETANYLQKRGVKKVGILATDGTIQTGYFQRFLKEKGIEAVVPKAEDQALVMSIIYDEVKAGLPVNMEYFYSVSAHLRDEGAEVILLGCTELSIIKRDHKMGPGYLDVLDVLAQASVRECGTLRKEYKELITR